MKHKPNAKQKAKIRHQEIKRERHEQSPMKLSKNYNENW